MSAPLKSAYKAMLRLAVVTLTCLAMGSWAAAEEDAGAAQARVVSIGGSVTEIIFALGQEHRLVARDTTSTFPGAALALPDVGYMRALSAEGVLSMAPSLIIAEAGAGPPETIAALQAAAIPFATIPDVVSADGILTKIRAVGEALNVPAEAERLARQVAADFDQIDLSVAAGGTPKRVLFVLSTQGGRIMAAGQDTAADGMIALAGAVNAITSFDGYKPVSPEAVSQAAPDVILMMDRGGGHGTDDETLFSLPAFVATPAAQNNAVIRMNGLYLLGFGPRTAQAVRDLNAALYGS